MEPHLYGLTGYDSNRCGSLNIPEVSHLDRKMPAWIHIVKKELALPDEEYCNILQREADLTSAKDLTDESGRI
jgi:hypothetical protein